MKYLILGVFVSLIFSCTQQESKKASAPAYFDIAKYFENEAIRLQKAAPIVTKEVIAKSKSEQKSIKIADWKTELGSFINADINKASWLGEFTETIGDNNIIYTTDNPKIPIKKIEIIKISNLVKGIKIYKSSENNLYASTDTLRYYPDSLYFIQNQQKIKLLSAKKYQIIGKLK